jgi:hypothetical protein
MVNKISSEDSATALDKFKDKSAIADYAINSISILVKEGLIAGNGGRINPAENTTRAETAMLLYKIYNK